MLKKINLIQDEMVDHFSVNMRFVTDIFYPLLKKFLIKILSGRLLTI